MAYGVPCARPWDPGPAAGGFGTWAPAALPGLGYKSPKRHGSGGGAGLLPWGLGGSSACQGDVKVPESGSGCSALAGEGMGTCVISAAGRGFSAESQEQTTNIIAEKCCFPYFAPINILLES